MIASESYEDEFEDVCLLDSINYPHVKEHAEELVVLINGNGSRGV